MAMTTKSFGKHLTLEELLVKIPELVAELNNLSKNTYEFREVPEDGD